MSMLKPNLLLQAVEQKRGCLGMYIETPASQIVELACLAGMDFVRLDLCHGPWDLDQVEKCILTAERYNVVPMVRINLDEQRLPQVIELGAQGVVVPDISTKERARAAVALTKFAPLGDRGLFSASRQSLYGQVPAAEYTHWSNENVLLAIQVESREALENIDAILSVEGIDMVLSGRGDLSNSLGVPGQKTHPLVLEAEQKIFSKALAKGKIVSPQLDGLSPHISEELRQWNEKGAYVVSLGVDVALFRRTLSEMVSRAKKQS